MRDKERKKSALLCKIFPHIVMTYKIIFNIFISYIIKVQHFLHTTLHTIQRKRKGL